MPGTRSRATPSRRRDKIEPPVFSKPRWKSTQNPQGTVQTNGVTFSILRPELIWPAVFEKIANGSSLTEALRRLPDPSSYAWAKKQLKDQPALRDAYENACEDRAVRLAEEIIELADER